EEMAQRIYREWFVHFRYPGHDNQKLVESELGMIPEGWEIKPLGNISSITMGQSPKSEYYNEIGNGFPFHQGVRFFGKRYPENRIYCSILNRVAEKGDILFSVRAPVGRMNIANAKIVIGRGLAAIRSNNKQQVFLHQQLSHLFKNEDIIGSGTIFNSVTRYDMHSINVLIPQQDLAEKYENIITPVYHDIEILYKMVSILESTRDLLLPKLISGQIDVSDLDIDTGEVA
ncbi:MAG TPA: restriction endonuclease subunit S, partial [bacterium]|nr:restriction endonuclease subunit S [bacterium]